jgi:hypothetical protein
MVVLISQLTFGFSSFVFDFTPHNILQNKILFFRLFPFKKLDELRLCYSSACNYHVSFRSVFITSERTSWLTYTQYVTQMYKNVRKQKIPVLFYCYIFKLSTFLNIMCCCINENIRMKSVATTPVCATLLPSYTHSAVPTDSPSGMCFLPFLIRHT